MSVDLTCKDPADYASADGKGYANGWNAALAAVQSLVDAQAARIDKALDMHKPEDHGVLGILCGHDEFKWPCDTYGALTEDTT